MNSVYFRSKIFDGGPTVHNAERYVFDDGYEVYKFRYAGGMQFK